MKTAFFLFFLLVLYSTYADAQQNYNSINVKDLNVSQSIEVSSTTFSSKPCPVMTEAQRDALSSPAVGHCIYNSDTITLNVYNGSAWKSAGGGVNQWITATSYQVDDVVIESNKFYLCLIAHTSGTFATDLAGLNWSEVSQGHNGVISMPDGGTDKALTPILGGVVYTDAGSMEILSAGTSGQELQSNGAAAPTWVNKSISGKAESLSAVTVEEIQFPASQLTETATGKYRAETGNGNLLVNPSGEHLTGGNGWSSSVTSTAVATYGSATTTTKELGSKQITFSCAGGASGGTCLFYQDVTTSKIIQGLVFAYVSTTNAAATQFYSRVNGSNNKSITLQQTSEFPYKIPEILGSASTGLGILVTVPASTTYTGTIDGAIVGAVDLKTDVDQSRIAGESYFAATASCNWDRTTASIGAFTTTAACPGPTVSSSSMGTWATTDTDLPKQTITNLPAGTYKATFHFSQQQVSGGGSLFAISDGTTVCTGTSGTNVTSVTGQTVSCSFTYTTSGTRVFEIQASTTSNTVRILNTVALTRFQLEYFGSGQVYTAPADFFSTDNVALSHKTTAIVSSDPVGTYNTYSYAINTNTKTICATPPSTLPTFADGALIYTRAYNAASTCGNPARYEIKIGSGMKTIQRELYKSSAKSISMEVAPLLVDSLVSGGLTINAYNDTEGVLVVDAGYRPTATVTTARFFGSDITSNVSGYLVINAQKKKDSITGSFNDVVTSPGVSEPKTCHYYFGGTSATLAAPTECTAGTCVEVYDSCGAITPPAWTGAAGFYENMTIANGTFANSSPVNCSCRAFDVTANQIRKCEPYFTTSDNTWATSSSGGYVGNYWVTSASGTGSDGYVLIECKGQAP